MPQKGHAAAKTNYLNKMILENAKSKRKNLSTAWIDYKKAFDSVSHSRILRCLEIFNVSPTIINFLENLCRYGKLTFFSLTQMENYLLTVCAYNVQFFKVTLSLLCSFVEHLHLCPNC